MSLCSGKTKSGEPCRAPAGRGGLCYFHANPETAKTLGQIGGLKNKRFTGFDIQVPDNITAADLCKLELQVLRAVLSGDMPAREAVALTHLFNLLHRHLPTVDIEKRLALLEDASECLSTPFDASDTPVIENSANECSNTTVRTCGSSPEGVLNENTVDTDKS